MILQLFHDGAFDSATLLKTLRRMRLRVISAKKRSTTPSLRLAQANLLNRDISLVNKGDKVAFCGKYHYRWIPQNVLTNCHGMDGTP